MAYEQRGLTERQERFHSKVIRDTRTMGQRVTDLLRTPKTNAMILISMAVLGFVVPGLFDLLFILGTWAFLYCYFQKPQLPFRMPMRSGQKDYGDIMPGTKDKPRKARGIYYFGNEKNDNKELWFANEDMRTHVLIFGSTGSGKTEALLSLAYNALVQSSGFIFVDGKGDNAQFAKVFAMARSMGREDDVLLINFMTGARDVIGPQEKRLSNTLNPFANGSSSMLAQLVVSLMSKSSASPDGDMWKGRAIGFVEALMRILVTMRDAGHILLDANTIRQYFLLPKLEAIVGDKLFIRDGQEAINLENLPRSVLEPIENYLYTLPGYNKERKGNQVSQVWEQHGYIVMQLTRVFTSLADTYGHIMRTNLAEVDLKDVVLNRRILCVLLPALEKSPDELSNLGKVVIASLKSMMAAGLGDSVEGEISRIIDAKPTYSKTPYLCILDEYGYYSVEGFAVVPAQARSLGFSVVFAGQDLPSFQKASKEEAASIGANTNIKICMKLEDPTETWDFFMKSAGEAYVTHVDSFQVDMGSVFGMYQDGRGARAEKRSRIDLLDLKEQAPGEAHFFFRSKVVRGKFFFANPKMTKEIRLNHFLKINSPSDEMVTRMQKGFARLEELSARDLSVDAVATAAADAGEELPIVLEILTQSKLLDKQTDYLARASYALNYLYQQKSAPLDAAWESADYPVSDGEIHIFSPLAPSEHLKGLVITRDKEAFQQAILNRVDAADQMDYVQRLAGSNGQQASKIAQEILMDMQKGTQYPPIHKPERSAEQLAQLIEQMAGDIALKKMVEGSKQE
jgi:intracellular multiplication protein IcmO